MDSHGRIFYIDHKHHTTTWQKPATMSSSTAAGGNGCQASESTPASGAAALSNRGESQQHQLLQLDQRYQRVRRAIASASVSSEADMDNVASSPATSGGYGSLDATAPVAPSSVTAERQREMLMQVLTDIAMVSSLVLSLMNEVLTLLLATQGPVVRFLSRPDFLLRAQQLNHPSAILLNRSSVKHMISRVRKDASAFERYQHNR